MDVDLKMNLQELYNIGKFNIIGINPNTKQRATNKKLGYSSIYLNNERLNIEINKNWRNYLPLNFGILCQYIPNLDLYYSVLDIDTKEFPIEKLQDEYPTCVTITPHGYHFHYLSTCLVNIKQLTGKDKVKCPIDIRGQRYQHKEGNYIKLRLPIQYKYDLEVLECDFNEVIKYAYSLKRIKAYQIEDNIMHRLHSSNTQLQGGKTLDYQKAIAYYLRNYHKDWTHAYDISFNWGLKLGGLFNSLIEAELTAAALMNITEYPNKKNWVINFCNGVKHSKKEDDIKSFGKRHLKYPYEVVEALNGQDFTMEELAVELKEIEIKDYYKIVKEIYK